MQRLTDRRPDPDLAPTITPLSESFPPWFAAEAGGGPAGLLPSDAHQTELDVCRELLAEKGASFDSLVVRRIRDGVCLEGYVEFDDQPLDLTRIARRVAGVDQVLNHLVEGCRNPRIPR